MLVKEMKGGKGERISTAKGGGKISGRKRRRSEEKCLKGERGEKIFGRKGKSFSGGTGPKGEGWRSWGEKALGGKRGKDLWEEKEEELRVGKGLRRKRGEINDLNRDLEGKDLREERP